MFKSLAISAVLIMPVLMIGIAPANADHRWRKQWSDRQVFNTIFEDDSYDPRFDGRFVDDEEDVIVVPRRNRVLTRQDYIDELYDYEVEPQESRTKPAPHTKKVKPKIASKAVVKQVVKTKPVQVAAVVKPTVKPIKKSPIAAAPIVKTVEKAVAKVPNAVVAKPVVKAPTQSAPVKQARLTLPPEDRPSIVAPKSARIVPSAPLAATTISCEKATAIVAGYGFNSVSPLICVGKTYRFKALRDGKSFEINLSAASGELTEVKKL